VLLIAGDGALRLMPFQSGDQNQQWERDLHHGYIRCRHNRNRVLDIYSQSNERIPVHYWAEICIVLIAQ